MELTVRNQILETEAACLPRLERLDIDFLFFSFSGWGVSFVCMPVNTCDWVCLCLSSRRRAGQRRSTNYLQWKYAWPLKIALEDKKNIKNERETGCISWCQFSHLLGGKWFYRFCLCLVRLLDTEYNEERIYREHFRKIWKLRFNTANQLKIKIVKAWSNQPNIWGQTEN